jgi:hypothetical protein
MNARLATFALAIAMMAPGCGQPRFDASTAETAKASMERLSAGMNLEQKTALGKDMATVLMVDGLKTAFDSAFGTSGSAPPDKVAAFRSLHGLTAAEIHDKAEAIRKGIVGRGDGK